MAATVTTRTIRLPSIAATDQLAAAIVPPAWGTIDAGDDKSALGNASDGYAYLVKFTSAAYRLDKELDSDWGTLSV